NIGGTEHFLGKYYLDDWNVPDEQTLILRAVDIIGVMDTTDFDGYFWASLTYLEDVLDIVLAGIDADYDLATTLEDVQLKGYIKKGSVREALHQVCFAAGGAVVTARSEDIRIIEAPLPYSDAWHELDIGVNDKFMTQPTKLKPLVTGIVLISHTYERKEDLETVYEDDLEPGTYKIIFDNPVDVTSISGALYNDYVVIGTEDGAAIGTEDGLMIAAYADYAFGPNSITLTVPEPGGTVTIQGYVYRDNQREHTFSEDLASYAKDNVLKVTDATLVGTQNAASVLARMRDYYRGRYIHDMGLVPMTGTLYGVGVYGEGTYGWSTVGVQIGQMVSIASLQGPYMRAVLEKANLDLTGGFLVKTTAVGVKSSS
ncbi:MAG: hypothetical protein SVT56_04910, partial [Chloroflexota bacterium]|nr:hypothetical protein [Chloroflexota bacterium]